MKIFIDPGHGGNDPGAIGIKGTKESDVVLQIAVKLKGILEKMGISVAMSRNSDAAVSLSKRAEMANKFGADIYISLHCNGFVNRNACGSEIYSYPGNSKSVALAGKILAALCDKLGTVNRGAKQENFAVLRLTDMPAVLLETAFITNEDDENMMLSSGFPESAAEAVAEGISLYSGISLPVKEENKPHWGKEYLDNLVKKGYINSPELWENTEGIVTKAMVLALVDKITEGRSLT